MTTKRLLIGLIALALPTTVLSGLSAAPVKPARAPETKAAPAKQNILRCWQYGQLIFEEGELDVPADAMVNALKLHKTQGDRAPLYLFDTKNATCLINGTWYEGGSGPKTVDRKKAARSDLMEPPTP